VFWVMTMCEIEFHCSDPVLREDARPYPASQAMPGWLKSMPVDVDGTTTPTIKRCPPFLGAMTAGYIFPAPVDLHFWCDAQGELRVQEPRWVETHVREQYAATPFKDATVAKFINPWLVRTPPGWSTMFCAPFNRFEIPFIPLAGVVETDTFYRQVNFPTICTLPKDSTYKIAKGTPLVQMIPMRREEWTSTTLPTDEQRLAETRSEFRGVSHAYKERYWVKQSFR
jgi:hypothetical protein